MSTLNRTNLSVSDLETFDPQSSTRSGHEQRFLCPLCGDGKPRDGAHRSLCANLETGAWNCQRCKATGKLTDFWKERPKSNPREIARSRRAHLSKLPEHEAHFEESGAWRNQLIGNRVLDGTPAESYLRRRGINTETATNSGVMFAPNFYGKSAVTFPLCDFSGQQTGASGRYFTEDATPKTRIVGSKKNGLFTANATLLDGRIIRPFENNSPGIIVTEAPLDALSLATIGFPAVALCGTSAPAWFHLACGLKRVFLALDADDAGDLASESISQNLKPYGARCSRLRPENAKDWNEVLAGAKIEGIEGTNKFSDWLAWHVLTDDMS